MFDDDIPITFDDDTLDVDDLPTLRLRPISAPIATTVDELETDNPSGATALVAFFGLAAVALTLLVWWVHVAWKIGG